MVRDSTLEHGAAIIQRKGTVTEGREENVTIDLSLGPDETLIGLVHTHPPGGTDFSVGDIKGDRALLKKYPQLRASYIIIRPYTPSEPFYMKVFEFSQAYQKGKITDVP